ncbi:MAG: hypothetical protein JWO41_767 [Candidatus Saccharibacteria bacterium]|nr:hypothetical protein [Candidatus Saccharibacteria bacterium]
MSDQVGEFMRRVDFGLVRATTESMACVNPVEGYAVIEGARYAIETYAKQAEAGKPTDFHSIVRETRDMLDTYELDGDPWKCSDEFNLGVAMGIYLARRTDGKPRI